MRDNPVSTIQRRRKNGQRRPAGRLRFDTLVSELCAGFIGVHGDAVHRQIDDGLRRIVAELGLECAMLGELRDDGGGIRVTHAWTRDGVPAVPRFESAALPWVTDDLRRGQTVCIDHPGDASLTALAPCVMGGTVTGALGITMLRRRRPRHAEVMPRLCLLAGVFAVALMRGRGERALAEDDAAIVNALHGEVVALARDGTVIAANDAWTRFAAENGADPMRVGGGVNYLDVCHRAAAEGDLTARQALEMLEKVLDGTLPRAVLEYPGHSPARMRWFAMTVAPFRRPEGGLVISHVDITRRWRAEEEVERKREELAHALRVTTLGEHAGSLIHEITQPLTAILGNAQAAVRLLDADARHEGDLPVAMHDIVQQARRASHVVRGLRALFKKGHADREPVDVGELIGEVRELLRKDLERDGVVLEVHVPRELPRVRGDVVQLQQVLLNVVVNAAEALAGMGEDRRVLRLAASVRGAGMLEITVCDSGIGVVETELETIFDRFVTTKPEGLGMGLSISRSIVQAHGGRIWATRNADHGLTLHIELPCLAS